MIHGLNEGECTLLSSFGPPTMSCLHPKGLVLWQEHRMEGALSISPVDSPFSQKCSLVILVTRQTPACIFPTRASSDHCFTSDQSSLALHLSVVCSSSKLGKFTFLLI